MVMPVCAGCSDSRITESEFVHGFHSQPATEVSVKASSFLTKITQRSEADSSFHVPLGPRPGTKRGYSDEEQIAEARHAEPSLGSDCLPDREGAHTMAPGSPREIHSS